MPPPNIVEEGRIAVEQQEAHRQSEMVPGSSVGGLHSFQPTCHHYSVEPMSFVVILWDSRILLDLL